MRAVEAFLYRAERVLLAAVSRRRAALLAVFLGCLIMGARSRAAGQSHTTWSDYGGGPDSSQHSALHEINSTNVSELQIAWVRPTGDENRYFFNPVEAHGLIYVLVENNSIAALNAATGKNVWVQQIRVR